ncbi:MAG: DNA translocase FtsK, partial [Chloroflexi bacterium]|nr:DNA translocase FtsK [Chloroflexota bacterium]
DPEKRAALGAVLGFLALVGFLQLLAQNPDPRLQVGSGGGYLGWALGLLLLPILGEVGSSLVYLLALVSGSFLAIWPYRRELLAAGQKLSTLRPPSPTAPSSTLPMVEEKHQEPVILSSPEPIKRATPPLSKRPQEKVKLEEKPLPVEVDLPPLELLEKSPETAWEEEDIEKKARIIEETLASFGVPAKVVSIVPGPTVTQFGLEPGTVASREGGPPRRVRVNQITALDKDLELALAASPVRIEAPVPGRPVVGIEVPNTQLAPVSLRGVMESEAYKKVLSPLKLALGRNVSGQPVVADLATMPHLLIAGATGSGKSVCLSSIVTSLLFQNPPQRVKLILVDPKPVELVHFAGLPHLQFKVLHDVEEALDGLRWAIQEMQRRYQYFKELGARHLQQYNSRAAAQGREPLPYIVIVVDELADLMLYAPFEVEQRITRLAQMARATGIHLVIATQRPSVDVVTGLIKANFPARISFAVSSQIDSRVILDIAGAETLLGRGDMLYKAPDSASPLRLQGCFVFDREIFSLVRWWQKNSPPTQIPLSPTVELEEEPEEKEVGDKLLEQALTLLRQHQYASTSFLQRKLGIGYPRAAKLMDQLEEMGYVAPAESGGRSRKVLHPDDVSPEER